MAESVAVIIATYGDFSVWQPLMARAVSSVQRQSRVPDEIFYHHGRSLAQARNTAAFAATTDWLIFLDADDELDEYYVEASLAGFGDIRQPATQGFGDEAPVLLPQQNLLERNYVVVAAMQRRESFLKVGGFDEYPALEDWDLWLKLVLNTGAEIMPCPGAIYRVYPSPNSRNENARLHGECYMNIRNRHKAAWERR